MTTIPVPKLVRLEYLTANGWVVGHKAVNLLHPGRYVERLSDKGKFGRATELDDRLQPTGQVWTTEIPAEAMERLAASGTDIPAVACIICSQQHGPPYDGSCLL